MRRQNANDSAVITLFDERFWLVAKKFLATVSNPEKMEKFVFSKEAAFPYAQEYFRILWNGTSEERVALEKNVDDIIKGSDQEKRTIWFLFCGTSLTFMC